MLPETELLQYIHKTADMGCQGIDSVLDRMEDTNLKTLLERQRAEYAELCRQSAHLLKERGEDIKDANSMAKMSADMMTAGKMAMDNSPSKVAEMTIQGTTMGVTKTIKHLDDFGRGDEGARALGEKLLTTQENNIHQLKQFL